MLSKTKLPITMNICTFEHLYISTDSLYADAARIGSRNACLSVARPAHTDLPNGQRGEADKMRPHFASLTALAVQEIKICRASSLEPCVSAASPCRVH